MTPLLATAPSTSSQTVDLSTADWQSAYDAAMTAPLGTTAALADLLLVSDGLLAEGAPEASLDLLGRALDAYSGVPALYCQLVRVLTVLDRFDDAEAALTLLGACTQASPAFAL